MKRAAILLFCCTLTLSASSQNLWQRIVKWVQSSSTVDTTYLYKRPVAFSVNTNLSAKNVSSTMTSYQTLYEASNDGLGDSAWVPSIATTNLNGNLKTGIGLGIGYGKLSAGYSWRSATPTTNSSSVSNSSTTSTSSGAKTKSRPRNCACRAIICATSPSTCCCKTGVSPANLFTISNFKY